MSRSQETLSMGVVQSTSSNDRSKNIDALHQWVAAASEKGCDWVAFPELFGLTDRAIAADDPLIVTEEEDPYLMAARQSAKSNAIWIHTGSTPVLSSDGKRMKNRSHIIDANGEVVARYDKIHVCDIYPEGADPILESATYEPGSDAACLQTAWGGIGLSICYDLRFPGLFRDYCVRGGASILFVPSAFSVPTGRAHWEILLRSRAIENGAFVVAPAQYGHHADGRETWGHSMVVSPTGEVLVDRGTENGLSVVTLELTQVEQARTAVPSLIHGRKYQLKIAAPVDDQS